jgi:MshEN domain
MDGEPVSTPLRERPDAPLGTLIFRAGLLPAETIESALEEGVRTGKRLGEILTERGLISEVDLTRLLAGQKGFEFVTLREQIVDTAAAALFTEEQARLFRALPYAFDGDIPVVAIADPTDDALRQEIREALGREEARFVVSLRGELAEITADVYSKPLTPAPSPEPEIEHEPIESDLESEIEPEPEPAYVEHLNGNGTADAEVLLQVPAPEIAPEPEPMPTAFEQPPAPEASAFQVPAPEEPAVEEPEAVAEEPVAFEVVGWPTVEPEPVFEPTVEPDPVFEAASEPEPAPEPEQTPEPQPFAPSTGFEYELAPVEFPALEPVAEAEPVAEPEPEIDEKPFQAPVSAPSMPDFEPDAEAEPVTEPEPEIDEEPFQAPVSAPSMPDFEPDAEAEPVAEPEPEIDEAPFQAPVFAPSVPDFEAEVEPEPLPEPEPAQPYPPAASQRATPPETFEEPETPVDASAAVETHAAWRVTIRLANGERVDAGVFDGEDAARQEARTVMAQVADAESGEWPFVSGRFLKPDTIVSVDITEISADEI